MSDLVLLTVYEVSYLLDMSPRQIYGALACGYLSGCKITGPSAHASWRIAVESARKFYERIYICGSESTQDNSANTGSTGFDSRLKNLQEYLLQATEGIECMEGRRGRVDDTKGRLNNMDRKEYRQLDLFEEL